MNKSQRIFDIESKVKSVKESCKNDEHLEIFERYHLLAERQIAKIKDEPDYYILGSFGFFVAVGITIVIFLLFIISRAA
jgi:hypothetical protein